MIKMHRFIAVLMILFQTVLLYGNTAEEYISKNNTSYKQAVKILDELKPFFTGTEKEIKFAQSVVFPEVMRYSLLRNFLEQQITDALYTAGSETLNCSIGVFQMKPVFAIRVEEYISNQALAGNNELSIKYKSINYKGKSETWQDRHDRIKRLTDEKTQIEYLSCFLEICREKYGLKNLDQNDLQTAAAAYNNGFAYTKEELILKSETPAFPNGAGNRESKWRYTDLSLWFFNYYSSLHRYDLKYD